MFLSATSTHLAHVVVMQLSITLVPKRYLEIVTEPSPSNDSHPPPGYRLRPRPRQGPVSSNSQCAVAAYPPPRPPATEPGPTLRRPLARSIHLNQQTATRNPNLAAAQALALGSRGVTPSERDGSNRARHQPRQNRSSWWRSTVSGSSTGGRRSRVRHLLRRRISCLPGLVNWRSQ